MAKKDISEHLADYLLGLARGPWMKSYYRSCMALWREQYGTVVADKVASLAKAKLKQ